jgi:hypothetical protein
MVCLLAVGLGLLAGCSNDKTTTKPPESLAPPTSLSAINDSSGVELQWDPSTNADDSNFKGYNVYRNTSSLAGVSDSELQNYWLRINTSDHVTVTPELTYFNDESAQLGTKYYYSVRAVRGDNYNELSTPIEIDSAPREEGAPFVVSELRFTNEPSAIDLAHQQAIAMQIGNAANIDVYLGTTDSGDATTAGLALKSPSKVQSENDWSGRVSRLYNMGSTGGQTLWFNAWEAPAANDPGWTDQITLPDNPRGMIIAVETPDVSGHHHYGKIWIQDVLSSTAGERQIQVKVAYQPIADYPRFARHR